jgi:pyridoxamine-phosphate oxidase
MPNRDYHDERRQYEFATLNHADLHLDPFQQFSEWMDFAYERMAQDPTAMSLSTVDKTGQPHSRIVLLKAFGKDGLVFYTHYESDKGQQIADNPKGALLFFWPELDRQVRIEGTLEKIPREASEAYFKSRPRDSQLAALISQQSTEVPGRKTLEQNMEIAAEEHLGEIPCPEHWGGYRLTPTYFEFWQGRPSRLHDRFRFAHSDENDQAWHIARLSP